jgi:hypothetical protein
MSDLQNNDTEEEMSEEEKEAVESFDLRTLGVEPMTTPISDLIKLYRENHSIVKSYTDSLKAGKDDPNDVATKIKQKVQKSLKSDEENVKATVGQYRTVGANLTEAFFSKTPVTSGLLPSAILLEELENLLSLAREEYAYHLNKAIQSEKDRLGIKATPNEAAVTAKLACDKLKTLIENRCNIAKLMGDEAQIPANLYKTEGQRKGFNTDVLPRSPKLAIDGPVGTNTTHLVFRWKANDEEETVTLGEVTLADVAHNVVSKGSYRVTGSDLSKMLKKAGYGIGATDIEWSLEFKTGTLYGKKA